MLPPHSLDLQRLRQMKASIFGCRTATLGRELSRMAMGAKEAVNGHPQILQLSSLQQRILAPAIVLQRFDAIRPRALALEAQGGEI